MAGESKSQRARAAAAAAKKPPAKAPQRRPHRGGLADALNMDSERSARLLLIGGVLVVVAIALGFIAFGYWNSVIKPRHRTVLEADGVKVSYSAMKRRMAYELAQNPLYDRSPQILPQLAFSNLVDEIGVVTHAEGEQGVTATDEEVGQQIGFKINAVAADQKTFAMALRKALNENGLTEDEFRRMQKAELLTNKINQKLTNEVPATVQQAKLEVIQTATIDEAKKAGDRVRAGEDWAAVAKEVSKESNVQTTGGLHDYAPRGSFSANYEDAAFSAPIGQVSDPLASADGTTYLVIRVLDRADRPVADAQKAPIVRKQYQDWLSNVRSEMLIVDRWTSDLKGQNSALVDVVNNAKPRAPISGVPTTLSNPPPAATAAAPADGGANANPPVPDQPVAPAPGDGGNGQ